MRLQMVSSWQKQQHDCLARRIVVINVRGTLIDE